MYINVWKHTTYYKQLDFKEDPRGIGRGAETGMGQVWPVQGIGRVSVGPILGIGRKRVKFN